MTRIGRLKQDLPTLAREAAAAALKDTGPARIARVFISNFAADALGGTIDIAALVLDTVRKDLPGLRDAAAGPFRTGGEALYEALTQADTIDGDILIIGCEKMTHVDAASAAGRLALRAAAPSELRYGATLPALAAIVTQSYMRSYRVPVSAFDDIVVKNHRHAAHNPRAHFQKAIKSAEANTSPLVADPLRRHHCAPMSDGAAACVLSRDGRGPVLRGWGRGLDVARFQDRQHCGRFQAVRAAARSAFSQAGITPDAVDVVEIHDAFAPFELINLEEMGFFAMGTAWQALARGELTVGTRLVVNPSGGMKARGHPIGVCGLTSLVEIHEQLSDRAGGRQQQDARLAVVQSAGGVARDSYVFVAERAS